VRSPSKKYVNELVDKMMEFKTKNECLVKENNKLKTELKSLKGDFF
jgi:regulator of replication initiation timing